MRVQKGLLDKGFHGVNSTQVEELPVLDFSLSNVPDAATLSQKPCLAKCYLSLGAKSRLSALLRRIYAGQRRGLG